jgi:hypothetical protein
MHQFLTILFWNETLQAEAYAPACKLSANPYDIYHCCVYTEKLDDGQRNCSKHVEFHSKIKFWEIGASSWFYYKEIITLFTYRSS